MGDPILRGDVVAAHERDDVPLRDAQARVERRAGAGILLFKQRDLRAEMLPDALGAAVAGSVIDDNDLKIVVSLRAQAVDGPKRIVS
ncbi:hypothetical protein WJ968_26620 [Achromobacter xylosoxidans]